MLSNDVRSHGEGSRVVAMVRGSHLIWGAAALLLLGCQSNTSELCEKVHDCESLSDNKLEECIVQVDSAADIADIYDCQDDFDSFLECELDNGSCETDAQGRKHFSAAACQTQLKSYTQCLCTGRGEDNCNALTELGVPLAAAASAGQ